MAGTANNAVVMTNKASTEGTTLAEALFNRDREMYDLMIKLEQEIFKLRISIIEKEELLNDVKMRLICQKTRRTESHLDRQRINDEPMKLDLR